MAKLPVSPSFRASTSVRQRFGGRSRVNLLHTARAAGHAAVHCVRRDASVAADGGDLVFIRLLERDEHDGVGETRCKRKSRRVGGSAGEITQCRQLKAIAIAITIAV